MFDYCFAAIYFAAGTVFGTSLTLLYYKDEILNGNDTFLNSSPYNLELESESSSENESDSSSDLDSSDEDILEYIKRKQNADIVTQFSKIVSCMNESDPFESVLNNIVKPEMTKHLRIKSMSEEILTKLDDIRKTCVNIPKN